MHPVFEEQWAVSESGKAVRFYDNHSPDSAGGINTALYEADLSDLAEERRVQLTRCSTCTYRENDLRFKICRNCGPNRMNWANMELDNTALAAQEDGTYAET